MKYLEPKFSVAGPGTQAYADAWDRIFKRVELLDAQGGRAEAPTAGRACAPTQGSGVDEANQLELLEAGEGGGVAGNGPGEGAGLPDRTHPSNQNEEGVSGFPSVKVTGATQ